MSTEVIEPEVQEAKKPKMSVALGNYVKRGIVTDFAQSEWTFFKKLAMVQKTPDAYIKSRDIGGKQIKYVDHVYAQKVLNFIFNFKVSNRLIKEIPREYNGKNKKGETVRIYESTAVMEYEFVHPEDGTIIRRTVNGSHKLYANNATTDGMALNAAISKSWTAVAKTFGIGAGLDDKELSSYEDEADVYNPTYSKPTPNAGTQPAKSFIPKATYA